jgi:excisionase family DNA binding protein
MLQDLPGASEMKMPWNQEVNEPVKSSSGERKRSYVAAFGEPLNYSVDEAAWAVGIGRSTLWEMIKKGLVETIKIGRRRLISKEEVHRIRLGNRQSGHK